MLIYFNLVSPTTKFAFLITRTDTLKQDDALDKYSQHNRIETWLWSSIGTESITHINISMKSEATSLQIQSNTYRMSTVTQRFHGELDSFQESLHIPREQDVGI